MVFVNTFPSVIHLSSLNLGEDEAHDVFSVVDLNGDGVISYDGADR